ncbi:ATP-dependent RNA helicase DHX58-like isoform X2 [Watersipora subatra]|uniref:ATP-dependent RNA helicase DHX58-like isoform X2 n=1 Tax=Watersipora subatra TaxID=2589382 RepID=UPI00355BC411
MDSAPMRQEDLSTTGVLTNHSNPDNDLSLRLDLQSFQLAEENGSSVQTSMFAKKGADLPPPSTIEPVPGALMTTPMVSDCELTQSGLTSANRNQVEKPQPAPRSVSRPVPRPRRSLTEANGQADSIALPVGLSAVSEHEQNPLMLAEFSAATISSALPQATPRHSLASKTSAKDAKDPMFKLRGYQEEISHNILNQLNDIIILPTGTGKTPIAIHAIWKHLQTAGRRTIKILFLAPRVALAEQQLEVIQSHLPVEWATKCAKLTGGDIDSMDELEQMLTGDEWSVIVATPQTVFNYFLAFEASSMRQFSLIIFDELHNAVGGHPYNRLLNQYMDEKLMHKLSRDSLPQLIGLTASVGLGDSKTELSAVHYILSMCAKVDLLQHPSEVVEYKEELEAIRNPPVEEHRKVEQFRSDPFSAYIKEEIMAEIISDVRANLRTHRSLQQVRFDPKRDVISQNFEQKCVQASQQLSILHDTCQNDKARGCIISIKHLRAYHNSLKWANLVTLRDAMDYLDEELLKPELSGNKFAEKYKEVWHKHLEDLASKECDYMNEKLMILKEELDKALSPQNCRSGEAPRVMIFVEYRRVASMLNNWVNSLGSEYRSERYVSRLASFGDFGMTQEQSQTVMLKFRAGELNILVATSVLSEGIDIPECNGTIRYMFMKDVIAEVQVPEMPLEEFLKKIESEQLKGYTARLAEKKRKNNVGGNGGGKAKNALINCKQCGRRLGQLSDVHRYLEAHYIILDKYVLENVDVTEGLEYRGIPLDGMSDVGVLVCMETSCNAELGRLIKIKINKQSHKLGVWDITKVRIAGSHGNFVKWEDVAKAYGIEDVKQEKLRAKIEGGYSINIEEASSPGN